MKKFTKFCMIAALVLVIVGGALFYQDSSWELPGMG